MTFEEYMKNKFPDCIDSVPEEIINLLSKLYLDMENAQSKGDYNRSREIFNRLESYVSQIKPQLDIDNKGNCK